MAETLNPNNTPRLAVDGRSFALAGVRHRLRAVAITPNDRAKGVESLGQWETTLEQVVAARFNAVRLYEVPPVAWCDAAHDRGILLLVGVPWNQDGLWIDESTGSELAVIEAVCGAIATVAGHPAVAAYVIGNELDPTMVRLHGPVKVRRFLERLIEAARGIDREALFAYATFPTTEYLMPQNADFAMVNVFLGEEAAFLKYVARLHHVAGNRPLVIGEFGIDAAAEGEGRQAAVAGWFANACAISALAGAVWFSWSDAWTRGGRVIDGWKFGLLREDGEARPALGIIQSAWDPAALELPPVSIRVSVIVCAYNAIATLPACLDGIMALPFQKHPLCEVIVVDDGSTDATKEYLATWEGGFSAVPKRVVRLNGNGGLSAARNAGAAAARGDVLAFIDADCVPSLEWICELLRPFEANSATMIVGGPNLAPKSLATLPKAIAAAPGSPVEVLRTDEEADHLPGCNLACRATMFAELGGFDPLFRIAGDDVDFCWRARNAGAVLRFAPGAWVWHRRRETVAAWLRQQWHYGRAEGLLALKHPERFAGRLAPFWAGCIYDGSGSVAGPDARVAHGRFGTASFQAIYGAAESAAGLVPPYFAWAALVCAAVGIFAAKIAWALLWIALGLLVAPRAWSYAVERRVAIGSWPGALLSGLLAVLQPVCRASGRLHGWLFPGVSKGEPPSKGAGESGLLRFRVAGWDQRMPFLGKLAERLRQNVGICAEDAGSAPWDFRVTGGSGFVAEVVTAMRAVPQGVPELLVKITLKRRLVSVTLLTCAVLALGLATAAWGCVGIVIPVLWAWLDPIGTRRQFHMRIVDAVNHCAREIGAERASEAVGGGIHL